MSQENVHASAALEALRDVRIGGTAAGARAPLAGPPAGA